MKAQSDQFFSPQRRMPLIAMFALGLAWLAFGVFKLVHTGTLASVDGWLRLAPALGLALVAVAFLPQASGGGNLTEVDANIDRLRTRVDALGDATNAMEVGLGDFAGRAQALAQTATEQSAVLTRAAAAITAATARTQRDAGAAELAALALEAALPRAANQASEIAAVVRKAIADAAQQVGAVDTMIGSVRRQSGDAAIAADQAMATMTELLTQIDDTSKATTSAIAKRAYALDAAVDGALERATTMFDAMQLQTETHFGAMETRLEGSRSVLESMGHEATRVISERLNGLVSDANQLKSLLHGHEEASGRLPALFAVASDRIEANLRVLGEAGATTTARLTHDLGQVQAGLADLSLPLGAGQNGVAALAEQLTQLRRVADELESDLQSRLPPTADMIDGLRHAGGALGVQAEAILSMLVQSGEAATTLGARIAGVRTDVAEIGTSDATRVEQRLGLIEAQVDRVSEQFGPLERRGADATQALGASLDTALAHIADAQREQDDGLVRTRTSMNAQFTALDERFAQTARHGDTISTHIRERMTRDLDAIGAQLADVRAVGESQMDALAGAIGAAHAKAEDLGGPLAGSHDVVTAIHERLEAARGTLANLDTHLAEVLPRATSALGGMEATGRALAAQVGALALAAHDGGTAIEAATQHLAAEHAGVERSIRALADEYAYFERAFAALAERTDSDRNAQSHAFAERLDQLRASADLTANAMRDRLGAVIEEAGATLDRVAAERAEVAFGAPIRLQIAAVEAATERASAATQRAAERIAGKLHLVSDRIDAVEARANEIDTRMDVRASDTLSARSTRLAEHLQSAAVDIGKLIALDANGNDWVRYLRGDKGVFARWFVSTIDLETRRKIARHYAHDEAFKEEANRYMDVFERLTQRVLNDPDGDALTATIVSSDLGKIYVALARGAGRWEPLA